MKGSPCNEAISDANVARWRRIARRDWARIRVMAGARDSEAAGFYLQQSLEKFLKAWLISQGQRLRKVHALQALLDMAATGAHRDLEQFRPLCERVSGYYVLARYPDTGGAPEAAQVERDVDEARKLVLVLFPDEPLA